MGIKESWNGLERKYKRWSWIAGMVGSVALVWSTVLKKPVTIAYQSLRNSFVEMPKLADSIKEEQTQQWAILEEWHESKQLNDDLVYKLWNLSKANMNRDNEDYYITSGIAANYMEGSEIPVYIREDNLRPPQHWCFVEICEDGDVSDQCDHYLFKAEWDGDLKRYIIYDLDGHKHEVYKRSD